MGRKRRYTTGALSLVVSIIMAQAVFAGAAQASTGGDKASVMASLMAEEVERAAVRLMAEAGGNGYPATGASVTGDGSVPVWHGREKARGVFTNVRAGVEGTAGGGRVRETQAEPGEVIREDLTPTIPVFQAVTHVIGSHLAVVTRPVTAGKRLFFLAYDTIKDALGWPAVSGKAEQPEQGASPSGAMDLAAWERRLDEMTGSASSSGTLEFLVDGEEYFPRFFEAIEEAGKSIKIRTYIFDNDDFAVRVGQALRDRSEEVDVRVLMDGLGTIMATGVKPRTLPAGHHHPLSVRRFLTMGSRVRVRQQSNPWFTGDHSKTVVVDDEKAFVGGMNFGREYRYEWHDLMVEVKGPVVGEIAENFGRAWAAGGLLGDVESLFHSLKGRVKGKAAGGYPVRLLYTRPGDSEIRNTQLEAIRRCRSRVYVENPYLTDDQVLDELVRASRRGVDVRVVLPLDAESGIINRSNILAANRMVKNGIRVYILPRMSHVKAAVYDGWACFGSANFDKLSFRVNYEVNIATSHGPAVRELVHRLFIPDFDASRELRERLPVKAHDYLLELVADQL